MPLVIVFLLFSEMLIVLFQLFITIGFYGHICFFWLFRVIIAEGIGILPLFRSNLWYRSTMSRANRFNQSDKRFVLYSCQRRCQCLCQMIHKIKKLPHISTCTLCNWVWVVESRFWIDKNTCSGWSNFLHVAANLSLNFIVKIDDKNGIIIFPFVQI